MVYEIHPDLKPLSANLKRLNVGKSFQLKDFEYELEENNFDELYKLTSSIFDILNLYSRVLPSTAVTISVITLPFFKFSFPFMITDESLLSVS